jgi:uncharacterized membrane protein (DUF373 family)
MKSEQEGGPSFDRFEPFLRRFDFVVITALEALLVLTIGVGIVILFILLARAVVTHPYDSVALLQGDLQKSFSGVLMVMLGLELLETLRTYFKTHHVKVEVILIVAIIAAGRHVIEIDVVHAPGTQLLAYGGLMLTLAASYFIVQRTHAGEHTARSE